MIEYRLATPADAAEIARLNHDFNQSDEPPAAYAARLDDPRRVDWPVLALLDGRAVGLANLRLAHSVFYPEPFAEVSEMFVEEGQRRKGIGMALLRCAEELARQRGAAQIVIATDFYNHAAQQLYRAAGYQHYDILLAKPLQEEREEKVKARQESQMAAREKSS